MWGGTKVAILLLTITAAPYGLYKGVSAHRDSIIDDYVKRNPHIRPFISALRGEHPDYDSGDTHWGRTALVRMLEGLDLTDGKPDGRIPPKSRRQRRALIETGAFCGFRSRSVRRVLTEAYDI